MGDADGDGVVDIFDVTHIQRAVADLTELDYRQRAAAGVNRDGSVTIADVTKLQRYLAEFITEL